MWLAAVASGGLGWRRGGAAARLASCHGMDHSRVMVMGSHIASGLVVERERGGRGAIEARERDDTRQARAWEGWEGVELEVCM